MMEWNRYDDYEWQNDHCREDYEESDEHRYMSLEERMAECGLSYSDFL